MDEKNLNKPEIQQALFAESEIQKRGASLIKGLSEYLTERYGRGFSVVNLKSIRKFYRVYSPSKGQSLTALSEKIDPLISVLDATAQKRQSLSARELTLPADSNIYASAYSLYLPDKALLQRKLAEWTAEFKETYKGEGE